VSKSEARQLAHELHALRARAARDWMTRATTQRPNPHLTSHFSALFTRLIEHLSAPPSPEAAPLAAPEGALGEILAEFGTIQQIVFELLNGAAPLDPADQQKILAAFLAVQSESLLAHAHAATLEALSTRRNLERSELRYRLASQATRDAIWDWDLQTDEVLWNEAIHTEYGYPRENMRGNGSWWHERIHPEDRARVVVGIQDAIDNAFVSRWTDHYRYRRADGHYAYVFDRGYITRNAEGRAMRMLGAMQDVTAQKVEEAHRHQAETTLKAAETSLVENQRRFELLAKATSFGVWYCDLPFNELTWNPEVKRHFWLPETATVTIATFFERIHPDDREPTRTAIDQAILGHEVYDTEFRTTNPDDPQQFKWIRAFGSASYNERGQAIHFDGITLDVTDRRGFEEARELSQAQLLHSQSQLRIITDSVPDFVAYIDADRCYRFVNKAYQDWFHCSADQIVGRRLPLFVDEATYAVSKPHIDQALKGEPVRFETRLTNGDGITRDLDVQYVPYRDDGGKVNGFVVLGHDISDIKSAQHALNDSLRTLQALNGLAPAISGELNLEKLIQTVTDAATELSHAQFGAFFYNLVDEKGESYTLYSLSGVPREKFEKFPMPRNTAVFAPTFGGEGILRSNDITQDPRYGKNLPHRGMPMGHLPVRSYMAVPVISRSGEVLGGLFFGHDRAGVFSKREEELVTGLAAQASIAIDNARLYKKTQEAVRVRDEFLSIASHELKTPLTPLKLQLQSLQRILARARPLEDAAPQILSVTGTSLRQINRLTSLIDDLLDVARISGGRFTLNREELDLADLVEEALERHATQLAAVQCSVEVQVPPSIRGFWDRLRIEQVFINLLVNALKYAPGTPINIRAEATPDRVIVSLRDEGPGIPVENQARIFDRFERVSSDRNIGGLGLGLFITRQIVEAHGGSIRVDSTPGHGATFIFELPRQPAAT
jgi:PAS domain S-box-containing protein